MDILRSRLHLFDRVQPGLDIGYTPADIETGRGIMQKMKMDDALKDVTAAMQNVASAGKTGIVGYCWGGAVAWKAACNLTGLACAVPYYGGRIPGMIAEQPKCPVIWQWGEPAQPIPPAQANAVAPAHKDTIHYFQP